MSFIEANREALTEQRARSGESLPERVLRAGRKPRVCAYSECSESFTPTNDDHVCCKPAHRLAHWRAGNGDRERFGELQREAERERMERIQGLLRHLGREERGVEQLPLSREFFTSECTGDDDPAYRFRLIRRNRWCRCNGNGNGQHIRGYDQDGQPTCAKCGGPLEGPKGTPSVADREVIDTMRPDCLLPDNAVKVLG